MSKKKFQNLKGKDYLLVSSRVLWFREEHPDWSIVTEYKFVLDGILFEALILDEKGVIKSKGHAYQTPNDFKYGYIEKAETKALGRALGFAGFGTEAALQEDEVSNALADSPIATAEKFDQANGVGPDWVLPGGKNKGKRLKDVEPQALVKLVKFARSPESKMRWKDELFKNYELLMAEDVVDRPAALQDDIPNFAPGS